MVLRNVAIGALVVLLTGLGIGDFERGNRLYRQGRYAEAVEAYQAALEGGRDTPELRYNLGTALLRLGRYDDAEEHFRAALVAVDPQLRERTLYNLGNRFLSDARQAGDPEARGRLLDAAIEAYKQALRIMPGDRDAKWNLELALRDQEEQPPSQSGQSDQDSEQDPDGSEDPQGGGGGFQPFPPSPSARDRSYADAEGAMTPEQAERILRAAEQDERDVYRQRLRRGQRERPVERDW